MVDYAKANPGSGSGHRKFTGSTTHPIFIFPVPAFIIGMFIFESWQRCCFDFLVCTVKSAVVGKTKMKPLKLPTVFPHKSRQYIKTHITY